MTCCISRDTGLVGTQHSGFKYFGKFFTQTCNTGLSGPDSPQAVTFSPNRVDWPVTGRRPVSRSRYEERAATCA